MSEYILSCCSTADLSAEHLESIKVPYLCFNYEMDGTVHVDDLGKSISFSDFYRKMQEGAMTRTSQPNADQYAEFFRPFLQEGKDILHVCLSSGLSGASNSCRIAVEGLLEEFPDRKILVIDSLGASSGFGLLVQTLADLRDEGKSMEEVYEWGEAHKLEMHHWFFSTDLTFYVRGGRISKASGWFGTVLNICPLLNMDHEGHLVPRKKIRGKSAVIKAIVEQMETYAENGADYNGRCYICNSACHDDARAVADLVEEKFPNLKGKVEIYSIGTTIGSHTGPGTVALFFWGAERVD
jgi:DegV family protein with EDD domain